MKQNILQLKNIQWNVLQELQVLNLTLQLIHRLRQVDTCIMNIINTKLAVEECNFGPMPWQVKLKTVHFNKNWIFPKLIL